MLIKGLGKGLMDYFENIPVLSKGPEAYKGEGIPSPSLALTFDDGPISPYTKDLLDVLAAYHIIATFFLVGRNVERHPELACRVVDEGHAVGNHSYSHRPLLPALLPTFLIQDTLRAKRAIYRVTDYRTWLFRPPYGHRSPWMAQILRRLDYRIVLWHISFGNWRETEKASTKRISERLFPGAVILLHDLIAKELPERYKDCSPKGLLSNLLESCLQKGYNFVTVPELLKTGKGQRS